MRNVKTGVQCRKSASQSSNTGKQGEDTYMAVEKTLLYARKDAQLPAEGLSEDELASQAPKQIKQAATVPKKKAVASHA